MDLSERIDAYLRGEMTPEDAAAFEQKRVADPAFDQQVVAHESFIKQLTDFGARQSLISEMNAVHERLDVEAIKTEVLPLRSLVRILWARYRINAAVAASVAVLAVFATLLSTGYFARTKAINSDYNALRREISKISSIQRSQGAAMKDIKSSSNEKERQSPAIFGATGFAITADGYVVTNFHVINGADSVYLQSNDGNSYKAEAVYSYPAYDIAVLKISDPAFKTLKPLPYTFRRSSSDLGEDVFTCGFPKDDLVYSEGYVSSQTGYKGDTTEYQVDISVNPGSSGGPLLDSKGNVIGVIKGKSPRTDGASFAIKSGYLLEAIAAVPQNSVAGPIHLNTKNTLSTLSRRDQIKKIQNYVYMVKVY